VQKWEYLFINFTFENDAWRPTAKIEGEETNLTMQDLTNKLGELGWELISHNPIVEAHSFKVGFEMKSINKLQTIRTVFKRPKDE
jgi:hypothetical protein